MPSGGTPFKLTETNPVSPTNNGSGSTEVSAEIPLGRVGGLTVTVGVITGVCGSGVGVMAVAVVIFPVGVAVQGMAVGVLGSGDGVMVAGTLVDVPVGVEGVIAGGDDN